ncbi:glycosyltransferase [Aquabacter cavernae]|uniref:glycosyltransferase n=1 Tax=Aquabacter cavernae TaxID=2496029 RepID=UPI000F8DDC86|nr:glycosyltransferase [Aquabacter cavernae]
MSRAFPIRAVLAFPGALDTPTGGYAYDREVLAHLPAQNVDAAPLALPEGFPLATPAAVREALRRLAAADPSTVLLVDGLALGALPAEGLAPFADRLVALVHHPLALEAGLSPTDAARLKASETEALALCRHIVTTSHPTAHTLTRDYGVAAGRISVAEPGLAPAPRSPADGDPPRLLCVGTVIPRKAHGVLVQALDSLRHLPWRLTIVGSLEIDPAEADRVRTALAQAGLEERVHLAGALAREALDAAYLESDLFVHPSLYEGYGMVLAEALRRGLPVVCTTGGAAAQTVPDGAGVKVPPGDAAALAAALAPLLADPDARRSLAARAYAAGQAFPGWDTTAAIIASVLHAAAGRVAA